MTSVISAYGLSKKYYLSHQRSSSSLREALGQGMGGLARKLLQAGNRGAEGKTQDEFWALRDVSFEVEEGDRIGIIGKNGAGKSTLLKILSRITEPTSGQVEITGRVASLLEVGTGFHPELTGRENIFLNGVILGMKHREIKRRFDEIVEFAGISRFLDTPVKRYSSGMYVRLAFSVAAHLEPDILIVDEVLAVGDAGFQKKCLGKMEDVSRAGRTVLFVSHNMGAVASLTRQCIEIDQGQLVRVGPSEEVIRHYLAGYAGEAPGEGLFDLSQCERPIHKMPPSRRAVMTSLRFLDGSGRTRAQLHEEETFLIELMIEVYDPIPSMEIHLSISTSLDVRVCSILSNPVHIGFTPGRYKVSAAIDPNYLRPGGYSIGLSLYTPDLQDGIKRAATLTIAPNPAAEDNPNWSYPSLGVVRLPYRWNMPTLVEGTPPDAS